MCEACYRAALARRGTCGGCGDGRRLVSPPGAGARLCCDCAGAPTLARCADCGIEDRPYADGRCVRCALVERSARLLGGPRADLAGLHHAIVSARQPYSAHNWLRQAGGAAILAEIASGALALTHEALDAHPRPGAARYVRQMMVAGGVLPARDEALVCLEAWVTERVEAVGDLEHRRLLRAYATWGVLRRARQRAEQAKAVRTPTRHAKTRLLAAVAFLAWLAERDRTLADTQQGDIEAWLAEGPASAHEVKDFLGWAAQRRATGRFEIPNPLLREGTALDGEQRWAVVARLLHDDDLHLTDRVAGCLVLLYAQQLSRIVAMTVDQVVPADDGVYLRLGPGRVLAPEPMGSLVVELVATGRPYVGLGSPAPHTWLFPGLHPGRPLHPGHLGERLNKLGIDARAGRRSALVHLAGQLPAAVLAEMLHLHATTAVHWVATAGGIGPPTPPKWPGTADREPCRMPCPGTAHRRGIRHGSNIAHYQFGGRGRRHHHRALAGPRVSRVDPSLRPRRPWAQAARPRPHGPTADPQRPLHPARQAPRLPRSPLNHAELRSQATALTRVFRQTSA
ncbi:MAG: hypothetical protein ACRD0D_15305 [Acidimicrobiales bacterium]